MNSLQIVEIFMFGVTVGACLIGGLWAVKSVFYPTTNVKCGYNCCKHNWKGYCFTHKQEFSLKHDEHSNEYLDCECFESEDA